MIAAFRVHRYGLLSGKPVMKITDGLLPLVARIVAADGADWLNAAVLGEPYRTTLRKRYAHFTRNALSREQPHVRSLENLVAEHGTKARSTVVASAETGEDAADADATVETPDVIAETDIAERVPATKAPWRPEEVSDSSRIVFRVTHDRVAARRLLRYSSADRMARA